MTTTSPARPVRRRLLTAIAAVAVALGSGALAAPAASADPSGNWTWDAPGWGYERVDWEGIWYTSPRGTHLVPDNFRNFDDVHGSVGGGRGALGYPTTGAREQAWGDLDATGDYQKFERGVIYGSFEGTFVLLNGSGITQAYNRHGGGTGALGYPAGHEVQQAPGWWYRAFSDGHVYASRYGSYPVIGDLDSEHRYQGGGGGFGYPTASRRQDGPGFGYQKFQGGVIYCLPATQSYESCYTVRGGFVAAHSRLGGGTGRVGYPISNQYYSPWSGSWVQYFERGTIEIYNSGRVVVS